MNPILSKSFQDIFSKEVIVFVLNISLASVMLTAILSYGLWGRLSGFITSYLSWIPWEWLKTSGASVMTFFIAYILFTIIISLLTSLYSEKLLIALGKKHYPHSPVVGSPKISTSLILTLKSSLIFLMLTLFLLPLLFVPLIGQVILLYLWSVLLREPTLYDVGTLFIADKPTLKAKKKKTRVLAMIASLFNYIPIVNVFAPVFAQILFLHHILKEA